LLLGGPSEDLLVHLPFFSPPVATNPILSVFKNGAQAAFLVSRLGPRFSAANLAQNKIPCETSESRSPSPAPGKILKFAYAHEIESVS
jgi:hypothetical protein